MEARSSTTRVIRATKNAWTTLALPLSIVTIFAATLTIWSSVTAASTNTPREYAFTISDFEPGMHYSRLEQIDYDGVFEFSDVLGVGVEVPYGMVLGEAYVNSFNLQASVRFWVTRSQHVEVALHDIQGRQIKVLL